MEREAFRLGLLGKEAMKEAPQTKKCPFCAEQIQAEAIKCRYCGERLNRKKDDLLACYLGLLLGPVGLWYKRQWAVGFVWLIIIVVVTTQAREVAGLLAPFFCIGMAVHAGFVTPRE
jgi:hypothetical protein